MAKKKSSGIDFKQLLLQKGERYGFYLAGALLLLFLFLGGFKAAGSASSGTIVSQFDKGVKDVNDKIARRPGEAPKDLDPVIYGDSTVPRIPFTEYVAANDLWNRVANEATKRLNPRLLPPIEAQVNFIRGSVLVYEILEHDGKWLVTVIKDRPITRNDAAPIKGIRKRFNGQPGQPVGAAPPTAPGGAPGRPPGPGSGASAGQMQTELEAKELGDKDLDSARLAETLDPRRMVVVTLAVPYKAQVEEYRRALRAQNRDSLSEYPEYRGFVVERRRLALDGVTEDQPWAPLDLQSTLRDVILKAVDIEPEIPPRDMERDLAALYPRVLPPDEFKLLVPRPKMYLKEFPPVNLPSVIEALKTLKAKGGQAVEVRTQTEEKFNNGDIFDSKSSGTSGSSGSVSQPIPGKGGPGGLGGYRPPPGIRTAVGTTPGAPNQALQRVDDEDAWMMRFLDVTVEPGHAYQYRVSLNALNPNYHKPAKELAVPALADKEMLHSDFYEVPALIVVPPEEFLYAAAKDDRRGHFTERMSAGDDVWVQMQKWFAQIRPDELEQQPFGEWLVWDVKAIRGQRVEEKSAVTLPLWDMAHSLFLFRNNAKRKAGNRQAEPSWTVPLSPTPPVVLVDFEGGSGQYVAPRNQSKSDAAGVEMLFVLADGQLRVARSGPDMTDPDRAKRDLDWRYWLDKVWADSMAAKTAPGGPGGGPGGPGSPGGPGGGSGSPPRKPGAIGGP